MNYQYTSLLADSIAGFIQFKHALGVRFDGGEYMMRRLDQYCSAHQATGLTRDVVEGFVADYESGKDLPDRSGLSYLRGFARFLQTSGQPSAHILRSPYGQTRRRPATFLLSSAQIEAFFQAAATISYADPWAWQAKAFFGLMLACGLRTCETRRLNRDDIDYENLSIDIVWSKGPRSRRLFVTTEVADMLKRCDQQNDSFAPRRQSFFVSGLGNRVHTTTPGILFNRIWQAAGLPVFDTKPKPGPYAFRHHFAYANIERWAANGIDPSTRISYLARYMGHADIESTYYYLHLSPDYTATYAESYHNCELLLPEVDND